MKYTPAVYGAINYGKLYQPSFLPTRNRLCHWEDGISFDVDLNDYNPLNNIYDETFFRLPYVRYQVPAGYGNRMDLISFQLYGDTDYWAYIMIFNRMVDPFEVNEGMFINIPTFASLVSWLTLNLIQNPIYNR